MNTFFSKIKYFDIPLIVTAGLLMMVGLALLYSISVYGDSLALFWKQCMFFVIGAGLFFFFSFFDYHSLAKANRYVYILFVFLLTFLLLFGSHIRGGKRWLDLGFFNFQVAEFTKIVIILGLARLLYLRRGQINSWKNIILSFLYAFIPVSLIILEPDLGSSIVILCIWAGIIFSSPINKKFIAILLIIFVAVSGVTWKFFLKPFQKDRIMVFLKPALDPRGRGYNVRQATIAVGSGQLFGRGLGQGLQSEHKFLPEKQTDFIFAASSEEIGFFGSTLLIALYFFFFYRLIKIMRQTKDDLGMYIVVGTFFFLFTHVTVNIGMNMGLLPVTGIPLPFLSYGGSSLIVVWIMLGIVQNIAVQSKMLRF
jgi:rod shape determining protein RodA